MTADTSAVIAALSRWHEQHDSADAALAAVRRLPAHVGLEAYSVLTRLPGGLAVAASDAARVLTERFPDSPLRLGEAARAALLDLLAEAGVHGGGAYDGLVGLEAKAHGETLLTLDVRALRAYQRLGVDYQLLTGGKGRGRGGRGGGEGSGGTGVREPRRPKPGGQADAVDVEPEETEKPSPKQKPLSRSARRSLA